MAEESRTLIERAFAKARESGRPDWHQMSVAVLKNRLLDLTERGFSETDYGASTFLEFVRSHDDLLELDTTTTPPVATLKGASSGPSSRVGPGHQRIRSDLWRAVLDFSSGNKYTWDPTQGVATSEDVPGPEIPTVTADTFNQWKRAFADAVDDVGSAERLSQWTEHRLPANFLPPQLRHRWIQYLKTEVQNHLRAWFAKQGLELPVDLLEPSDPHGISKRSIDLRKRLIDCLLAMTPQELERVQIPASVLLRLKK